MTFVVFGLNHKTAPIEVREKIAFIATTPRTSFNRLSELPALNEIIVLSTCNRTELYCETEDPRALLFQLSQLFQFPLNELTQYIYELRAQEAVHHLLRVACGLDSMMLGEPQILGQLKRAYQDADEGNMVKGCLHYIFQFVLNATKRIRTQSGIGKNPISIAYAAVQLITQRFKDLSQLNVFIIGSGETASLVAKYLHQQGVTQFMIANRTKEHAELLAQRFNGNAFSITDIPHELPKADVVISATACPLPFINKSLIEHTLAIRNNAFMFLLDLSIPRDIEANVAELEQICLYNIDDLHNIVGEGMEERRAAALEAEQLVNEEMLQFIDWERTNKANELITHYRNHMKSLAALELQRAQKKLGSGKCQYSVLNELCERLLNKLTHLPTQKLRQFVIDERGDLMDLVQFLPNQKEHNPTL